MMHNADFLVLKNLYYGQFQTYTKVEEIELGGAIWTCWFDSVKARVSYTSTATNPGPMRFRLYHITFGNKWQTDITASQPKYFRIYKKIRSLKKKT